MESREQINYHLTEEIVATPLNSLPDDSPGGVLVVEEVDESVGRGGDAVFADPVVVRAAVRGVEAAEPHHAAPVVQHGLLCRMRNSILSCF